MLAAQLESGGSLNPVFHADDMDEVIAAFRCSTNIVKDRKNGRIGIAVDDGNSAIESSKYPIETLASLAPLYPEWLGDRAFSETHKTRFCYVGGAMANGIATTKMVTLLANAGMLGFFGAAGLAIEDLKTALNELKNNLDPKGLAWGSNLINSPQEPQLEERVVDLYLSMGVRRASASAFMQLTPALVRYACSGLHLDAESRIQRKNFLIAKISRPEIAELFMRPAPSEILEVLLRQGLLNSAEVELARHVPLAEDITVEADSGGHTDRQTLGAIFPTIAILRDRLVKQYKFNKPIRIGAAGGLGTPSSVSAAFSLGAAYVLTGTVNQACVESGLHETGRKLLAMAKTGDVTMTPASDMFEMGVKLQVLKKGTMYPNRASKLYELYTTHDSLDAIPQSIKLQLEKDVFKGSLENVWQATKNFWAERDPGQIEKAECDAKHKMALVFRYYLGLSSHWAISGDQERILDYQIWCGPAIAAFNQWTAGSFLENYQNRSVVQVALNLLEGAAMATRAQQLRSYGVPVPSTAFNYRPRPLR